MSIKAGMLYMHDTAAWYDLAPSPGGIVLAVQPAEYAKAIEEMTEFSKRHEIGEGFEAGKFSLPSDSAWGFRSSLKNGPDDGRGWITVACAFPEKTGKEFDWKRLFAASFSLQVLLSMLNGGGDLTAESRCQYLTVDLYTDPGRTLHGAGMGAKISPRLMAWLKANANDAMAAVDAEMERLGARLFGADWAEPHEYDMRMHENGILTFNCPGNACDLGPCRFDEEDLRDLDSHNMDSPMQQLSILAGLAALNAVARQAGV